MLGYVRAPLGKALGARVKVTEVGRDYTHLAPARLHSRLAASLAI